MSLKEGGPDRVGTVLIAGFGPVGAACAAALSAALPAGHRLVVLDSRPHQEMAKPDARMIAVSYGSRVLLERLGAWRSEDTSPIRHIHVSERNAFGRTLLAASDYGIDALGYVIPYAALTAMLTERVQALPVDVKRNVRIEDCEGSANSCQVTLTDGTALVADYVIHAEGQPDEGAPARKRDYRQSALSAMVTCSHPQAETAFERFTGQGPLALLPAKDGYALVWCANPSESLRRTGLSDRALLDELQETFGDRLGRFQSIGPRASIPLGLNVTSISPGLREFAIGNAAQSLHPVAGQGFNLGLRDAFLASDAISAHFLDPQLAERTFVKSRALDRNATIGMTDLLSRVFATPLWPVRAARGSALALLDIIPALRHPLARQMMNGQR